MDLTLIPDEDLKREYMRRLNATRRRAGGRPTQLKSCPNCRKQFAATTLRLVHLPECRRKINIARIANALRDNPTAVYAADSIGRGSGQWVRIDAAERRANDRLVWARDVATGEWFTVDRWEVR